MSVELAGRTYKVNVKESERSIFESASAMVNDTINGYEANNFAEFYILLVVVIEIHLDS